MVGTQYAVRSTHLAEGAPRGLAKVVVGEIDPRERLGVAQCLRKACAARA